MSCGEPKRFYPDTNVEIPYDTNSVNINGVEIQGSVLANVLNMITRPNPKMWYRFELYNGMVRVHTMPEAHTTTLTEKEG